MPYAWQGHYGVFVVDLDRHLLIHIDLKYQKSVDSCEYKQARINRAGICYTYFLKYLARLNQFTGDENNLHSITWTSAYCVDARKYQDDRVNCGVIMMNLMDHIGRGIPFEMDCDPYEYRQYLLKLLLKYSLNMEHYCIYCYSQKTKKEILCRYCGRIAHLKCRPYREIDIQNDDGGETTTIKDHFDFDTGICAACAHYCNINNQPIDGMGSEPSSEESNEMAINDTIALGDT